MLRRWIHAQERRYATRDLNRLVRPFEWGASFIKQHTNGDDPRDIFLGHAHDSLQRSADFYALGSPVADYQLRGDTLTWTSSVHTPSPENNTARARFFPAGYEKGRERGGESAVLVLPQWNADQTSHVGLCRLFNRFRIAALRVTLPYHEARRPHELERADYLVSSNIGRTIQSVRQAVLDTRAALYWLTHHAGYKRVGIIGTSIGSCVAFLTFAHDENIKVGVFNHVSGYVADVVWNGISTKHVRDGFGNDVTLDELREYWLPISPYPYAAKLLQMPLRPMRFIAARYDLSFPPELSRSVIAEVRRLGLPLDVAWLPCGHYTCGENPWKYLDGWKIVSFFKRHL